MKQKNLYLFLILASFLGININISAQEWKMKQAPLMTDWSKDIDPDNLFNEYPRPQMERKSWTNLNGVWEFAKIAKSAFGVYKDNQRYNQRILVPFPIESAISGIMDTDYTNQNKAYVYRRTFTLSDEMKGKEILLHFGGVDWQTKVFVNQKEVGLHEGAYDPFYFNITSALKTEGEQELVVFIYDPTEGGQPRGKQAFYPGGIWYTPCSGIWQTVWMEAVEKTHIHDLRIIPDVDNKSVKITVNVDNATDKTSVSIKVLDKETEVATGNGNTGTEIVIPINNPKLWSPDSPFLYSLKLELTDNGTVTDEVDSYFGMRKIELGRLRGQPYMLLNDEPVFHYGPLDQGYWPDGNMTAPSYDALRFDLEATKELGMNMTRKHIKVEPARWFYYCDSIGLLVWQDMPSSLGWDGADGKVLGDREWIKKNFLRETENIVKSLINYPSIIMWVPYNEAWGQFDENAQHTQDGVNLIRSLDDTRLINPVSGWTDFELGDINDRHNYSDPALYPNPFNHRAVVCGETGGYGLVVEDHLWKGNDNPYISVEDGEELTQMLEYMNELAFGLTTSGINGLVYTEITDVEEEINGFYSYDRKVSKLNDEQKARFRTSVNKLMTKSSKYIVPTALQTDNSVWKYTTGGSGYTVPAGWNTDVDFNDSSWKEGVAGFGGENPPNTKIRTSWTNQTIYLRKMIHIDNLSQEELNDLRMSIYYDEDFEVYVNGVLAASATGYSTNYVSFNFSPEARAVLKPGEDNLFAIKCIQTYGGQYIDLGLITSIGLKEDLPEPELPLFTEISTVDQLNAIQNDLSGFYKLTADIDLEGIVFTAIGTQAKPFCGYFDGNGHVIKNLELTKKTINQGLFGYTKDAYITNLEIANANINTGRNYVGALIGTCINTKIDRILISGSHVEGSNHVGAIVGSTGEGDATFITDSYVANGEIISSQYIGGIVGSAKDTRIKNCYFHGILKTSDSGKNNFCGGIIGYVSNPRVMILNSVSLASSLTGSYVNPFAANGSSILVDMQNCYARSGMQFTENPNSTVGFAKPGEELYRSISELKSQTLYEAIGWDFENIWRMPENGYPVFKNKEANAITNINSSSVKNLTIFKNGSEIELNAAQPASVWIYDTNAKLISHLSVDSKTALSLPSGVYIYKSVSNGQIESGKIPN